MPISSKDQRQSIVDAYNGVNKTAPANGGGGGAPSPMQHAEMKLLPLPATNASMEELMAYDAQQQALAHDQPQSYSQQLDKIAAQQAKPAVAAPAASPWSRIQREQFPARENGPVGLPE